MNLSPFASLFLAILVSLPSVAGAAANPMAPARNGVKLVLAENGRALLPIVIATNATPSTKAVANELASYLQRITGAPFEVTAGDGARGIVLGTINEFPSRAMAKSLEVRNTYDGREAFVVRSESRRLLLLGATDLGVSHAASRFLELVGCRWFFPAREWEIVPATPRLSFSADEASRPAILARRIWYGWGFFPENGTSADPLPAAQAYRDWARHNRMAGSFTVNAGHAWENIIEQNKSEFDQHPEYFALNKGARKGPQLCVSQSAVQQMSVDYALRYFRKNPKADMVSMECSDGGGQCECEDCVKRGNISDRVFGLANHVAKAVQKELPGKFVGLYAYNEHSEPPSFPLEPNVYVQLTAGFITGRYRLDELIELWPKRCQNMGFYEYFSVWDWDFDRLPGGSAANVAHLRKRIGQYLAHGATSIDAESGNNWGPHGRGYYIANRLMWDPQVDVEALLADFYDKAFGPGAAAMRRYYERLDPGNKPLLSRHLLGQAFRDVEEASRLAKDRADIQARLDHIKQYLRYVHLRWMLDREKDKARQKELTLATLTHAYRTRYSFMNHWESMRQAWLPKAAKTFEEPSWVARDPNEKKPWAVETFYSHDETEATFQEGLSYFQLQPITERTFSTELVPVQFTDAPSAASSQGYQGGLRYALYSTNGEPLELSVTTGTIAWYRDRADARYTLLSAAEETLHEGRLPLDGEAHKLQFQVPRAGLYFFDFDDSSAGWRIQVAAERPASILLRRDKGLSHMGHMQTMYFYVPKGTRQIDYFWSGGPHRVHGADKKLMHEIKASGEFVSIPVPEGMDGQPWHFTQLALGHLWFFNLPNQLAASPNALLLPREVVRADRLSPRR